MKRLIILLVIILLSGCVPLESNKIQDQPSGINSQELAYTEIIQVPGAKKKDLYLRARDWFMKTFYVGTNVMKIQDPENGELVGYSTIIHEESTVFNPYQCAAGTVHYTIHVWVKDGRYKYDISRFYHVSKCANVNPYWNINKFYQSGPSSAMDNIQKENYRRVKYHVVNSIDALIVSLKSNMSSLSSVNENW